MELCREFAPVASWGREIYIQEEIGIREREREREMNRRQGDRKEEKEREKKINKKKRKRERPRESRVADWRACSSFLERAPKWWTDAALVLCIIIFFELYMCSVLLFFASHFISLLKTSEKENKETDAHPHTWTKPKWIVATAQFDWKKEGPHTQKIASLVLWKTRGFVQYCLFPNTTDYNF